MNFKKNIMKNKFLLFFLASIILTATSCNNDKTKASSTATSGALNAENQKIYDDIMTVHDEVMPKMGDLNADKQKLRDLNDNMGANNIALKDTVLNTILVLSKLEDNMSDWMSNFKTSDVLNNTDSSHTYLVNQKKLISEMNDDIKKGLEISNSLLKRKN